MLFDRAAVGDRHRDGVRQPVPQQPVEREFLAFVDRRRGFVEEQQCGLVQQNPGERDPLLLAG